MSPCLLGISQAEDDVRVAAQVAALATDLSTKLGFDDEDSRRLASGLIKLSVKKADLVMHADDAVLLQAGFKEGDFLQLEMGKAKLTLAAQAQVGAGVHPKVVAALSSPSKKSVAFLSHMKGEAGDTAAYLHEKLAAKLHVEVSKVFIDTESLHDLHVLVNAVQESCVLVVLLTASVLARPWVLCEIYTALENKIPIVTVNLEGKGYDFKKAEDFLNADDFAAALDAVNKGASAVLVKQGLNPAKVGAKLAGALPYLLATKYDPQGLLTVREAMIEHLVGLIVDKL